MRKLSTFLLFLIPLGALGQNSLYTNFCVSGAQQSLTSGLASSNYLEGVIPQCLVTVFLSGTMTQATIYSNASGTALTNPFQANMNGAWLFYASNSLQYDCMFSGGTGSNVFTTPVTITGCFGGGISSGLSSIGPTYNVTSYGANVGAGLSGNGTITSGSNQLIAVTPTTGWIPNMGIQIAGAGPGGTQLLTTVLSINGSTFTLADNASTSVANAAVYSDDGAAIKAAIAACVGTGNSIPTGGIIQFPGGRGADALTYFISTPIYAGHQCNLSGTSSNTIPTQIAWWGHTAYGAVIPFSSFTIAANTGGSPFYGPSSPAPAKQPYYITITATNSLTAGTWVNITGCTGSGIEINNTIAEVAAAASGSFTVVVPYAPATTGSLTDSTCSATSTTVGIAFDALAHFQENITNLFIWQNRANPAAVSMGADVYFGSRIDSGSRIWNSYADSGIYYDWYFANGGIDVDFDKGWRVDASSLNAMVYWRVSGEDNFKMATGSLSNDLTPGGAYVMLDNQGCGTGGGNFIHAEFDNNRFEVDVPENPGYGIITLLGCPGAASAQFFLHFENNDSVEAASPAPNIVLLNSPDTAVLKTCNNSILSNNFINMPGLQRGSLNGSNGYCPQGASTPSGKSAFSGGGSISQTSIVEDLTDVNLDQLWQDGVQASAFMYSDYALAAVPNATTLYEGQIIAPPTYWVSSTPARYALEVVKTPGTTGTPNYGVTTANNTGQSASNVILASPSASITATSCTGTTLTVTSSLNPGASVQVVLQGTAEAVLNGYNGGIVTTIASNSTSFTFSYPCSSFTNNPSDTGTATISQLVDLSPHQYVTIGSLHTQITSINSSNPAAVVLQLGNNATAITVATALTYTAPVLGPEMQLLTKSAAAPSTGTWVQGDYVENSGASAQGIAGWVNTASGTPGTWDALPLGNAAGQLAFSQVAGVIENLGQTFNGQCLGVFSGTAGATTLYGDSQITASLCNANYTSTNGGFDIEQPSGNFTSLTCFAAIGGVGGSSGVVTVYDLTAGAPASGVTCTIGTGTSCTWSGTTAIVTHHRYAFRVTSAGGSETLASAQCGVLVQ